MILKADVSKSEPTGSKFDWNLFLGSVVSILPGLFNPPKNETPQQPSQPYYPPNQESDKTLIYVIIGAVAVVILAVVFAFKKK